MSVTGSTSAPSDNHRSRSKEFGAVLVEKIVECARRTAGDLLERVSRVVVLTRHDRPFAGDEQLDFARGYARCHETLEDITLGRDAEGHGFTDFLGEDVERLGPRETDRSREAVMRAPQRRVGQHTEPGLGHVAMVDQRHATVVCEAGPGTRGAYLTCRREQRPREDRGADRRVRNSSRGGKLIDAVVRALVDTE